ncbi:hypothetical protein PR048_013017 [Dryococelus australis]|uniref:Uncharacterized protein n=1 Tax=Dryococelus australis TaxID=614101 RepID=A0ABQ9HRA2_9NEOP|nr:hypothetical protein PR048_013017 [Dryococelus australis]
MSSHGATSPVPSVDKVETTPGTAADHQQQQQQQTKRASPLLGSGTAASTAGSMLRLSQQDTMWGEQMLKAAVADLGGGTSDHDGSDSELSDSEHFLAKGAFLLTPSHELSIEKASTICEKMNFKGLFSLTKTATGILFKFSEPEDFQTVFKKGFHKVTGARFYKKVSTSLFITFSSCHNKVCKFIS